MTDISYFINCGVTGSFDREQAVTSNHSQQDDGKKRKKEEEKM
jgi:hypothetical protein